MKRPLLACVATLLFVVATSSANGIAAEKNTVRLPTELDALALAPLSQLLLYGQGGIETQLPPGRPMKDRERVEVGLGLDGSISSVTVRQRLTLSGLGDFSFRVPGPAKDVRSLPGSSGNPGLRKGSVLWQGFSSGREVLAAEVDLMPGLERQRLPLSFDLNITVGGAPLRLGQTATGPFRLLLHVTNSSGDPIGVERAPADPAAIAPTLDELRTTLREGTKPVPGRGAMPKAVPVEGRASRETTDVRVPFAIAGRISFRPGSLENLRVRGGKAKTANGETIVAFRRLLGGGAPDDFTLWISGDAHDIALPELTMQGLPSLPSPRALDPPVGRTWVEGIRLRPSVFDGRKMLSLLMDTMWQVARIRLFHAYLGNPDPFSTDSKSTFFFSTAPRVAPPPVATAPPPGPPSPLAVSVFSLGAVTVLIALALLWSRS